MTVQAGATAPVNPTPARNWAAIAGGATFTPGPGSDDYAGQGCGPEAAIDQAQLTGWSTGRERAPGSRWSSRCASPSTSPISRSTPARRVATTPGPRRAISASRPRPARSTGPGPSAASGAFDSEARHVLSPVVAAPGAAAGVRHVRVSLLSSQGAGDFLDLSEFVVHGAPVPAQVQPPIPRRRRRPARAVPLAPPSFSLPASGKTTVKFKVTCAADCRVTAKLTVDRPTAKRLRLGRVLTAGSLTASVKAGKKTLTLKLKSKARRALLKGSKKARYRARLKVTGGLRGDRPSLPLAPADAEALTVSLRLRWVPMRTTRTHVLRVNMALCAVARRRSWTKVSPRTAGVRIDSPPARPAAPPSALLPEEVLDPRRRARSPREHGPHVPGPARPGGSRHRCRGTTAGADLAGPHVPRVQGTRDRRREEDREAGAGSGAREARARAGA